MSGVVRTTIAVCAIGMLVGACDGKKLDASSSASGNGASILSYQGLQIDSCSGDVPPLSQVGSVVRVYIPAQLNVPAQSTPATGVRNVRFADLHDQNKPEGNEDNYDNSGGGSPDTPADPQDPINLTPFHIDLGVTGIDATKYVMVRLLIIQPSFMTFYTEHPDSAATKIDGVAISPDGDRHRFCGAHVETNNPTKAIFYVKPKVSGKQMLTGYSFGLVSPAWPDTPIIIDPKVKQPG